MLHRRKSGSRLARPPAASAGAGVALVAALLLAGCNATAPAGAQTPASPLRNAAQATGFATTPPEPQDFVKKTRPKSLDYMAIGVTPPPRPTKPRDAKGVKDLESELDQTLKQHKSLAGQKPKP